MGGAGIGHVEQRNVLLPPHRLVVAVLLLVLHTHHQLHSKPHQCHRNKKDIATIRTHFKLVRWLMAT
jgi:hypothetical protein